MNPRLVFVYGTLKRPFWNSSLLERSSKLLGEALTVGKFYLADCGFPYLVPEHALRGHRRGAEKQVYGQLWEVADEQTMASLDRLEGVSGGHYQHSNILVELDSGEKHEATAYVPGNFDVQEYPPSEVAVINGEEVYSWAR